jgi:hypothetical protein
MLESKATFPMAVFKIFFLFSKFEKFLFCNLYPNFISWVVKFMVKLQPFVWVFNQEGLFYMQWESKGLF